MVAVESPSPRPPDTRLDEAPRLSGHHLLLLLPLPTATAGATLRSKFGVASAGDLPNWRSPTHHFNALPILTSLTPTSTSDSTSSNPPPPASPPETQTSTPVARQRAFDTAELSKSRPFTSPNDRHDRHEPTSTPQQRQQLSATPRPLLQQSPDPVERLSTPSSQPRSLRRTPKFEAPPTPEPRQVHLAAASVGFTPKATVARVDHLPEHHPTILGLAPLLAAERQPPRRRRRLSQDLTEDIDEESSIRPQSVPPRPASAFALRDRPEPHPALRISKHTHSAILFTLEEALRKPHPFTPDYAEESAQMTDIMSTSGVPPPSNGKPATFRGTGAPNPTGSPSGIRGPRMIMQERAAREARQRAEAEQLERQRAEEEARLLQEARRRDAEGRPPAGVAVGQGSGAGTQNTNDPRRQGPVPETTSSRPRAPTTSQAPPQRPTRTAATTQQIPPQTFAAPVPVAQPTFGAQTAETSGPGTTSGKPRNSFPHAFERWETLSAHWEGLTSYWIRKLEQNKDEINRDPINQQLGRQVTDLSAAGANLFHAVVELQRLRASSERKFQRWFFETRAELERAQEVNAMLEAALDQERRGREDAIRDAVENERGTSKAQKQLAEMRKELAISKEEARRAWEELGRREQEERDRTLSLQSGQPTIVGGVQVVPMTQGAPSRHASTRQGTYPSEYGQGYPPEQTTSPQGPPPATSAGTSEAYPPHQGTGGYTAGGSEGGYSEGEYVIDANGNFILDAQGRKIPFAAAPSTYTGSDVDAEDYETPATTNPPSGKQEPPSSSAGSSGQWTGAYSEPQDYSGSGYGAPGWETVPRHHHPTRLSDVIEEEDERSRTSASHSRV